jgi:hypothetical protein
MSTESNTTHTGDPEPLPAILPRVLTDAASRKGERCHLLDVPEPTMPRLPVRSVAKRRKKS